MLYYLYIYDMCGMCDVLLQAMVSALHSIVSYTCAYAWLGSSGYLSDSESYQQGGAEWGGLEGIGRHIRTFCVYCYHIVSRC